MKKKYAFFAIFLVFVLTTVPVFAQRSTTQTNDTDEIAVSTDSTEYTTAYGAESGIVTEEDGVSVKKEIAIFSLGFNSSSWRGNLNLSVVDSNIRNVFLDLGRFTVLSMGESFTESEVGDFVNLIKSSKEANFVLPEKYQFGEAFLTEADFNKLIGAFIIAIPTVIDFKSSYNDTSKSYSSEIRITVTFIDVSNGTVMDIADITATGSSSKSYGEATDAAERSIGNRLQFAIRSIPAFQNVTKILSVNGPSDIKIQLGKDMGIVVGDEYSIIVEEDYDGFVDTTEAGLLLIKEVGNKTSTAINLFSDVPLEKGLALREIPRIGSDLLLSGGLFYFLSGVNGISPVVSLSGESTRGGFSVRFLYSLSFILNQNLGYPFTMQIGPIYSMYLGRLQIDAKLGVALGSNVLIAIIESINNEEYAQMLSHLGADAGLKLSFLINKDLKAFAQVNYNYMYGLYGNLLGGVSYTEFQSYSGAGLTVGVTIKG